MEIKEQTRKQAAGCSKHCFEVADGSCRGLKRFSKSIIFQKAEVSLLRPVSIVLKRLIFYSGSTKILICDLS